MGRQSARIYFQGREHKDIYFNGHYHGKMYLADNNGRAALVWEKLKSMPVKGFVSMISRVNGKFYAVVEDSAYGSMAGYGSPLLYEGSTLDAMKKTGYIWEGQQVRGEGYIMYSGSGKLVIMRTHGTGEPAERYIAVIPLTGGAADLANVSYQTAEKEYYYSNFKNYIYGNGADYYNPAGGMWDPAVWKNGNKIAYNERIGGIAGILPCGSRIVGLPGQVNINGTDAYLAFFVLDDDNDKLSLHKADISGCTRNVIDSATEYINKNYNMNSGWSYIRSTSVTAEKKDAGGSYAGFVMVSESVGYVALTISTEINFVAAAENITLKYSEMHRVRIDFRTFDMMEFSVEENHTGYIVYSQVMDGTYRVQIVGDGGISEEFGLLYGRVGQDYKDDVKAAIYPAVGNLRTAKLTCLAKHGNKLIVGIADSNGTDGNFIIVDTVDGTAEYKRINIREE